MASKVKTHSLLLFTVGSCCVLTLVFHGRDFIRYCVMLANIVTGIELGPH